MQCLSSFSHAWTHVVQYRAQSLLPCPFYQQSSEASNHKSTDEATIISLFADSASPSSSSRNHLTALVLLVVLVKDFLDANKVVVSACRRHLRTTYRGLPQWCSPSNALRHTTKKIVDVTAMGKEFKYSYYLHFFCTQGQYIKITICKGPLTLIEAKLMGLATKDINSLCMHAELRRLVCMALY